MLEQIAGMVTSNAQAIIYAAGAWFVIRMIMTLGVNADIKANRTDEEQIKKSYGGVNKIGIAILIFLLLFANGKI